VVNRPRTARITARITGMGHAVPAPYDQRAVWDEFFADHYAGVPAAGRIFAGSGVRTRHAVANPVDEDVSSWGTAARMQRYLAEAMPLGKDAVTAAVTDAGVDVGDVGLFAVASCTGYVTPGIDIRLARDLGMSAEVQRLLVGHMGCYAALPSLAAVNDFVLAQRRPAVLLCVELTSLHLQPPNGNTEQVVVHALFGDAASAVVVRPGPGAGTGGLRLVDFAVRTDPTSADHMTWEITDLGFRMGLSPQVPDVLARHVGPTVTDLLGANGLGTEDVSAWAVHPGGPKILETVQRELGLSDAHLAASRAVLAEHGNCSSATVLMILDRLRAAGQPPPGGAVVMMAFGPGLTLYTALLRA
jgi:alkylresorcinol/alkylpyrone synthase